MSRLFRSLFFIPIVVFVLTFGILCLVSGRYQKSILRAREATCNEEAFVYHEAIDQYSLDKGHPPKSLRDLVEEHYLLEIPTDPCTLELDSPPVLGDPILNPNFSVSHQAGLY
jgi:general secretion pathway protein G